MKQRNKLLIIFLILFSTAGSNSLRAQKLNIDGDTLYVNTDLETQLMLPGNIEVARLLPEDAASQYRIRVSETGLTIVSLSPNPRHAMLHITEGDKKSKREHNFNIFFKRMIATDNTNEFIFDYSTKKKLKAHQKLVAEQRAAMAAMQKPAPQAPDKKPKPQPVVKPFSEAADLKDMAAKSKLVVKEQQRIDVSESNKTVSIQCQDISFYGNNVYFKFVVTNKDDEPVLPGTATLQTGKKKKAISFPAQYLSPSPFTPIPVNGVLVFVYATKSITIEDKEELKLTFTYGKKDIDLLIPGDVYNKEKARSVL